MDRSRTKKRIGASLELPSDEIRHATSLQKPTRSHSRRARHSVSAPLLKPAKKVRKKTIRTSQSTAGNTRTIHPISRDTLTRFELTLLSPFRYPVDTERIAAQIARMTGMLFVFLGAFGALYNIQLATNSLEQYSVGRDTNLGAAVNAITDAQITEELRPNPEFNITESTPLQKIASINVTVAHATHVVLSAYNTALSTLFPIGLMRRESNILWKHEWNTEPIPDGSYRIQATVINSQYPEGYTSTAQNEYTVLNSSPDEQSSTVTYASSTTELQAPATLPAMNIASQTTAISALEPNIILSVPAPNPLVKTIDTIVYVSGAQFVELYVQSEQSLTPIFIGLASKVGEFEWRMRWDTRQIPNGNYNLFASIRHAHGISLSKRYGIAINNAAHQIIDDTREAYLHSLGAAHSTPFSFTPTAISDQRSSESDEQPVVEQMALAEAFDQLIRSSNASDEEVIEIMRVLSKFEQNTAELFIQLSIAERSDNRGLVQSLREDIRSHVHTATLGSSDFQLAGSIAEQVTAYLEYASNVRATLIAQDERMLRERVGDAILNDSDSDGLTDYDEVAIYRTDPFSADTDLDGFTDGAEVAGGYDPRVSTPEAIIVYESPRTAGPIRNDIISVTTISGLQLPEHEAVQTESVGALITGRALPNSYVTLYIFSTPLIAVTRTDAEGNWNYFLEKNLEDGDHELYVALTDNTGRIIAKSSPFAFTKSADTYVAASIKVPALPPIEPKTERTEMHALLAVASIAVAALGLVLVLLAFYATHLAMGRREIRPAQ